MMGLGRSQIFRYRATLARSPPYVGGHVSGPAATSSEVGARGEGAASTLEDGYAHLGVLGYQVQRLAELLAHRPGDGVEPLGTGEDDVGRCARLFRKGLSLLA